jgi:hypothetical protein
MTRPGIALTLALGLLAVAAQGLAAGQAAPAEALSEWQYFTEARWDPTKGQGHVDFLVPPAVFDKARPDLADLRLVDDGGHFVPYALRVRRAQDELRPLDAREFNKVTHPDRSVEWTLDLGKTPGEHNAIDVITPGRDFRRRLKLEGSDDEKTWHTLLDNASLMHFEVGPQVVDVHRLNYAASRYSFLKVQVFPDRSQDADAPAITSVGVFRSILVPGEDVTLPANVGAREPVPASSGPGSAWTIDFGGDRVPCERLQFTIGTDEFVRPFAIEVADSGEPRRLLTQGEWRRRRGEEARPLEVRFPEVMARRLRLVVTDYRNPPLTIQAVSYTAPARQVVFAPAKDQPPPLRLYFGNPQAAAPHYDFAASLPEKLDPAPERGSLRSAQQNPEYRPPPKPLTERWPWLVYVVLGTASVVLLVLLVLLGREAMARHDRRAAASSA